MKNRRSGSRKYLCDGTCYCCGAKMRFDGSMWHCNSCGYSEWAD